MHDGLKLVAEIQLQSLPIQINYLSNAVSIVTDMHSKLYVASTYTITIYQLLITISINSVTEYGMWNKH